MFEAESSSITRKKEKLFSCSLKLKHTLDIILNLEHLPNKSEETKKNERDLEILFRFVLPKLVFISFL